MIITKEQQEALVSKYIDAHEKLNLANCINTVAFISGINATIKLVQDIEKRRNEEVEK